ncbi:MAG: amidohydrolase family protein [Acidobacteria bacterium]|nr:amidohydrolase family protein [Acidobacteriota bacterium]
MRPIAPIVLVLLAAPLRPQEMPPPIIDMHLHAQSAAANGPPPTAICAPLPEMPVADRAETWPNEFLAWLKNPPCTDPIWGPKTDQEVMEQTIGVLKRRNIFGVTSGPAPLLERWKQAGRERIIPALWFGFMLQTVPTPAEVRQWFTERRYAVFSEVAIQYDGISPSDTMFEPYLAVVEEMDVPVGIHIGLGPPGALYLPGMGNYRARLHSPLVLEEALARHRKLRVYLMHAGWPMLDDLLAVLYAHPQVHVDVGIISYLLPRAAFHRYLQRIVEAGFARRVMFGSDQMNWPAAIERAIQAIEAAPFLTTEQKRDILFNNAARFLRLSQKQITAMSGKKDE